MKAALYCRKSTDSEDRQVLSLPSQKDEMLKREGGDAAIAIEAEFAESRSAKRPGRRPLFEEMLQRVERGDIQVIVCWHPDRLARNMVDGGRIIDLFDTGKLIEIRCAGACYLNTPQDKLNLTIQFTFSKYTVDKLSEDIARGFRKRVAMGWAPGRPTLGYKTNKETSPRETVPDPERFELVERMWRLLLTGTYSVPQILRIANNDWGLRTPKLKKIGGGPLSLSALYAIFSRMFYAGVFKYKGELQQGKHQPMITLDEFARAQFILGKADRPRPKRRAFTYTGLMKCCCGLSVTAEQKTNRYGDQYDYYHCTRRHPDGYCRKPYISAKQLESQIAGSIDRMTLVPEAKAWLLNTLEHYEEDKVKERDAQQQSIDASITATQTELRNLTTMRVREMISDEEFTREREVLATKRLTLNQRRDLVAKSRGWIEPAREVIEFSNRAADYFSQARPHIKRMILEIVGSNPTLNGKMFKVEARKPFRVWPEQPSVSTMCTFIEDVRTFFQAESSECADLLKSITKVKDESNKPQDVSPADHDRLAT